MRTFGNHRQMYALSAPPTLTQTSAKVRSEPVLRDAAAAWLGSQ